VTPKQLKVLDFVRDFIRERGVAPTLEEIASHMRVCKVTARQYLQALERRGAISRKKYGWRGIEINSLWNMHRDGIRLPLLGCIAAGSPLEAVEIPETLDLDENFAAGEDLFALRVKGDSMVEEGILDGDYVIIQKREAAQNGDTVVALLDDGTATLKKFYREKNRIRLQPANEKLKPLYVKTVAIQGVVRGVFRRV